MLGPAKSHSVTESEEGHPGGGALRCLQRRHQAPYSSSSSTLRRRLFPGKEEMAAVLSALTWL